MKKSTKIYEINSNIQESLRKELNNENKTYYFTLSEIANIVEINSNGNLEKQTIEYKVRSKLKDYCIIKNNKKLKFSFYPFDCVPRFIEDLESEGTIFTYQDAESIVNEFIPIEYQL